MAGTCSCCGTTFEEGFALAEPPNIQTNGRPGHCVYCDRDTLVYDQPAGQHANECPECWNILRRLKAHPVLKERKGFREAQRRALSVRNDPINEIAARALCPDCQSVHVALQSHPLEAINRQAMRALMLGINPRMAPPAGQVDASTKASGSWLIQGNPDIYDIDTYLAEEAFIYWDARQHRKEIQVHDEVFVIRSGENWGLIGFGEVVELAESPDAVKFPAALRKDLESPRYKAGNKSWPQIGITMLDVRLDASDGSLSKDVLKADAVLGQHVLFTRPPIRTVFPNTAEQSAAFHRMWVKTASPYATPTGFSAVEGDRRLREHYRRERSALLIKNKKKSFQQAYGRLLCEICGFRFDEYYPSQLGDGFIEVHHLTPLSHLDEQTRTTLDDLLLVCSNCHRMIHRTTDADANLSLLRNHFGNRQLSDA